MSSSVRLSRCIDFNGMLEALPEPAMLIHLASGRITGVNSLACSLLNLPAHQLIGMKAVDSRASGHRATFEAALLALSKTYNRPPAVVNEVLMGAHRCLHAVSSRFGYFEIENEPFALHFFSERLEDGAEPARQSTIQHKNEFFLSAARELRNPLTSILGFLDLISEPESSERDRGVWIAEIRKSSEMLMGIVQNLLDLGQMETGSFQLEHDAVPTSLALAHVLSQARTRGQHLGHDVIARYTTPVPHTLTLDPTRFRQCLSTLIHFVIENTSRGDVTLQTAIIGHENQRQLAFDVSATCTDLDPQDLESLLDPWQSPTMRARSWKLAFTVAAKISIMMGGNIQGGMDAGRIGMRLTIQPNPSDFQQMVHLSLPEETQGRPSTEPPLRLRGSVLLIENNDSDIAFLSKILRGSGLRVDHAPSLDLQSHPFQRYDAVLVGIDLPHANGPEPVEKLRTSGVTVPIVALTTSTCPHDHNRCLESGCTAVVTKPIERTTLLQRLDDLISTTEDRRVMSVLPPDIAIADPLPSTLETEPSVRQILPQLVMRMPRLIKHIAQAIRRLDLPTAARTARSLGATAGNCGFESLSKAAHALADACEHPPIDTDVLGDRLEQLENMAKRVQAAYPDFIKPSE